MRNLLSLLAVLVFLNGCSQIVQKMNVQQGNVITPDMIAKIHLGMTQTEVKDILGPPILSNVFDKNRMDYAYTYKPGHARETEKSMTLIFRNERLVDIQGNMYSAFIK